MIYKVSGISRKTIQAYVLHIKKLFGLENKLYFPILRFAENILPQVLDGYNFEVVDAAEMGNKHGETIPSKRTIRIREDIYENAVLGSGRDRLTVAHEVGHLLLHESKSISLCRLAKGRKLKAYEDPEWQANCFGGELLASSYLIKDMNISEVVKKCGVSYDAAAIQLKHSK